MPEAAKDVVMNVNEVKEESEVDFVFSAVDMRKIKKSRKSMQRQRHRLYQTTVHIAGHRMYRW